MIRIQTLFFAALIIGLADDGHAAQTDSIFDSYGMAAGHYDRQEYQAAIDQFRDVIQQHPSTRQAAISYFYLAESLVQLQDYRSAFPAYKIFLERLPKDNLAKRAEFRIGECAYRLDWESRATEALESFIEKYPDDSLNEFALTYLGEIRLQRNEPHLALKVFDRALIEFPDSNNARRNRFGLARALQALNRFDEALRFFNLITVDPANPLAGQAKLQIGIIEFNQSQWQQARQTLGLAERWMQGDRRLPEAYYWQAKTEMALKNFSAAYEKYRQVMTGSSDQELMVAVLFDGALAASKVAENQTALAWLNRLIKTWPDSQWADDALQLKIELLYQQKEFDEAIIAIEKFTTDFAKHKNLPWILEYRGRIHYDRQEHLQTVDLFNDLIRRFGKSTSESESEAESFTERTDTWRYFKGLGQLGLKKYEAASETLAMLDMHQKEDEFRSAVLLAEASCAVGMQMPDRAISFFEEYLATGVEGASADRARSDLVLAYAQADRWQQADKTLDDFSDSFVEKESLLQTQLVMAELALNRKRFDLAERNFRSLSDPANPRKFVVRGLSGIAWVRMNRGDEVSSVEVFESLIDEFSETPFAAEAALVCGKFFEQKKQFSKAVEMYRHIRTRFGESSFASLATVRIAYCLTQTGLEANRLQAESMLLAYLNRHDVHLDEAQYQLAWIYLDSGRDASAFDMFESIVETNDSPFWSDAAYRVAKRYVEQKQYDQARPLIQRLKLADVPAEIESRINFLEGQLALNDEDWNAVHELMTQVLSVSDDEELRKKSRYWLAESLFHTKQFEFAETEFSSLIENPNLISRKRMAWAALRKSQCLVHLEKWSAAMDLARESKTEFPQFEAHYEFDFVIGRSHAAQGRLSEARRAFRNVIDSEIGRSTETAAMAQWRIGETYFHQDNYERAIESYYKVDSLYGYDKWRAAALVEAGKCQEQLGNWNHAVKLYQQLIEKFPSSEFCVAAEQRMAAATRQAQRTLRVQKK